VAFQMKGSGSPARTGHARVHHAVMQDKER
jgi:hypothetical protein